jgi:hypothetical protein
MLFDNPSLYKVAGLLLVSNLFMTFAWYGHLKFLHGRAIIPVILISWGIALFEYCFAVPANRLGSGSLSGFQLKIIQEIVTLTVFMGFARFVLGEKMRWNYAVSFALIAAAAWFAFAFRDPDAGKKAPPRVESAKADVH